MHLKKTILVFLTLIVLSWSESILIPSEYLANFFLLKKGEVAETSVLKLEYNLPTDNPNTDVFSITTDWENGVSRPMFCFCFHDIDMLVGILQYLETNTITTSSSSYLQSIDLLPGRFAYMLKSSGDMVIDDSVFRVNITKWKREMVLELFTGVTLLYNSKPIIGHPSLMIKREGARPLINALLTLKRKYTGEI
jgi:hypothetical protein